MMDAAHAINPRLAFVPCCYFTAITPQFVNDYGSLLDGFLFLIGTESGGANLKDPDLATPELKKIKALTGPNFPVVIDVYATAHSTLGKSTPEYVRDVMTAGKRQRRWRNDLLPPGPGVVSREIPNRERTVREMVERKRRVVN